MEKINLSNLGKDILVFHADYLTPISAQELRELLKEGEATTEEWYVAEKRKWTPDARYMLNNYIENEADAMYEGWEDNAFACINKEWVHKIDAIIEKMFDDSTRNYYVATQEIDVTK